MKEYLKIPFWKARKFLRWMVIMLVLGVRKAGLTPPLARFLDKCRPNRQARFLRGLLCIGDFEELIRADMPWWRYKAMDRIEALLDKDKTVVFEYGSGSSTLWLAKRCKKVISVEYDPTFFEKMKPYVKELSNVELILCPPAPLKKGAKNDFPSLFKPEFEGFSFEDFVKVVDRDDARYDLVVVDGRCRMRCVEYGLKHLKAGGVLMLDDSERKVYRERFSTFTNAEIETVWGFSPANPLPGKAAFFRLRSGQPL